MKKMTFVLILVSAFFYMVACTTSDNIYDVSETQEAPHTLSESSVTTTDAQPEQGNHVTNTENEYCIPYSDEIWSMNIHEIRSQQQGSNNDFEHDGHDAMVADFVYGFSNVYTVTFDTWLTSCWYDTIILWSDTSLSDFSIVSLNSMFYEEGLVINTLETLLAIDEMLPTYVVTLNVVDSLFYANPRLAIIFTDDTGLENRMFILGSLQGGYCPRFYLHSVNEYLIYEWD